MYNYAHSRGRCCIIKEMEQTLLKIDAAIIHFFKRMGMPAARGALCIVFFWFGLLKVVGASPAEPLVIDLMKVTIPFITAEHFMLLLGVYEMLIGLTFLVPRLERLAILLLFPHLIVTAAPLALLPEMTWGGSMIPTLTGQYIIKNVLIVATAIGIAAHLEPMHPRHPEMLANERVH